MNDFISKPVRTNSLHDALVTAIGKSKRGISTSLATSQKDLSQFPVIDEMIARDLRTLTEKGEVDFFTELIDEFLKITPELLVSLEQACNKGDRIEIEKLSHRLKGSCRNIGLKRLGERCDRMENHPLKASPSDLIVEFAQVSKDYKNAVEMLVKNWRKTG